MLWVGGLKMELDGMGGEREAVCFGYLYQLCSMKN